MWSCVRGVLELGSRVAGRWAPVCALISWAAVLGVRAGVRRAERSWQSGSRNVSLRLSVRWCKGSTEPFGGFSHGSNPCRTTILQVFSGSNPPSASGRRGNFWPDAWPTILPPRCRGQRFAADLLQSQSSAKRNSRSVWVRLRAKPSSPRTSLIVCDFRCCRSQIFSSTVPGAIRR